MVNKNIIGSSRPIRILFMAFGHSIHARRRIGLFADDPAFQVTVVSTYNYNFPNARNLLLNTDGNERASLVRRIISKIRSIYDHSFLSLLDEVAKEAEEYKKIKSYVKEFKPDVVFLQTVIYPCYLALLLPRSFPIVITFWNGDVLWWAQYTGIERIIKKQIVSYGAKRAVGLTVNSQSAFSACLSYGVSPDKIHLIRYPGVDLAHFCPKDKIASKEQVGISHDRLVVFCPRGLGSYLNSDVIVKAAALVLPEFPHALFLFVSGAGGNEELARHQQMALELGVSDSFRWEGQVPWMSMPDYYNASDVMVSISSNDSLPNCMLESMACGVPVIMGDIPQIREWVTDGDNGYLVPPRDEIILAEKIKAVFENKDTIFDAMKQKNIYRVMLELDSQVNTEKIKDLVKSIVSKGNNI